jgi:hypothetical protein
MTVTMTMIAITVLERAKDRLDENQAGMLTRKCQSTNQLLQEGLLLEFLLDRAFEMPWV